MAEVYSNDGVVENNSNTGNIDVSLYEYLYDKYVGGVFGRYIHTKASDLVNKGDVSALVLAASTVKVGGVIGSADYTDSVSLASIVNEGAVEVNIDTSEVGAYVGGVLGYSNSKYVEIRDALNKGSVTVERKSSSLTIVGGVAGLLSHKNARVETSFNYGDVDVRGGNNLKVGGIAGYYASSDTIAVMQKCGNEGNLHAVKTAKKTSEMDVGGLIGEGWSLHISDSYNSGNVSAGYRMDSLVTPNKNATSDFIGGLVGDAYDGVPKGMNSFFEIERSINIGDVYYESSADVVFSAGIGGIVGSSQPQEMTIKNVANYGSVSSNKSETLLWMGGVVGYSLYTLTMKNIGRGLHYE